jgi:hypothetical protein
MTATIIAVIGGLIALGVIIWSLVLEARQNAVLGQTVKESKKTVEAHTNAEKIAGKPVGSLDDVIDRL